MGMLEGPVPHGARHRQPASWLIRLPLGLVRRPLRLVGQCPVRGQDECR